MHKDTAPATTPSGSVPSQNSEGGKESSSGTETYDQMIERMSRQMEAAHPKAKKARVALVSKNVGHFDSADYFKEKEKMQNPSEEPDTSSPAL